MSRFYVLNVFLVILERFLHLWSTVWLLYQDFGSVEMSSFYGSMTSTIRAWLRFVRRIECPIMHLAISDRIKLPFCCLARKY